MSSFAGGGGGGTSIYDGEQLQLSLGTGESITVPDGKVWVFFRWRANTNNAYDATQAYVRLKFPSGETDQLIGENDGVNKRSGQTRLQFSPGDQIVCGPDGDAAPSFDGIGMVLSL